MSDTPAKPSKALFCISKGMGNHCMALPAIQAIAQQTGNTVDLVTLRGCPDGVLKMLEAQPYIDRVFKKTPNLELYTHITGEAFGHTNIPKQNIPAGVQRIDQGPQRQWPHERQRHFDPARTMGWTQRMPRGRLHVNPPAEKFNLPQSYVAIGMDCTDGDTWSKRRWPHWEVFARWWGKNRTNQPLVFVGVKDDEKVSRYGINLIGKTTPLEAAEIIGGAELYIGVDNGPSHVAAAVGTPVLAIYGPTTGLWNAPCGTSVTIISANVNCRPCFLHRPGWRTCKDCKCMSGVKAHQVIEAAERILERNGQQLDDVTAFEAVRARANISQWNGIAAAQRIRELQQVWIELSNMRPKVVVEIGSYRGGWLYTIAPACASPATLIGIDPNPRAVWAKSSKMMQEEGHTVHMIRQGSDKALDALKAILGEREIDVLHIDGDHRKDPVLRDWDMYAPLVKSNGLVILHDADNPGEEVPAALKELTGSARMDKVRDWRMVVDVERTAQLRLGTAILRML